MKGAHIFIDLAGGGVDCEYDTGTVRLARKRVAVPVPLCWIDEANIVDLEVLKEALDGLTGVAKGKRVSWFLARLVFRHVLWPLRRREVPTNCPFS